MVLLQQAILLASATVLTSCIAYAKSVNGPAILPAHVTPEYQAEATVPKEAKIANAPKVITRDFSDRAPQDSGFEGFVRDAGKFVTQFIKRDVNEREVTARDPHFKSLLKGVGGILGSFVKREEPATIYARSERTDEAPASSLDSSFVPEMGVNAKQKSKQKQHSQKAYKGNYHNGHGEFTEHEDHIPYKAHYGQHNEHSNSRPEGYSTGGRYSHKLHEHQHYGKYSKGLKNDHLHHMGGYHSPKAHNSEYVEDNEFAEYDDRYTYGHQLHKAHGYKHHGEHKKSSKHKSIKGKSGHKAHHGQKHLSEEDGYSGHKPSRHGRSKRPGTSKSHPSSKSHKSHKHNKSYPKLKLNFPGNVEMVHYESKPHEMIRFHPRDAAPYPRLHKTSQ